ncbi:MULTISPECIES: ABC transporter substrate-binding protein [unclassified Chelatococcus]|uniref:ABC transporter substrate-binding protein n=1 Tax=unclassified Chelatococcus TaxID=2638111 RepID=UPI001BCB1497|nr:MULTISPECIES: ABC transporter substrate-binding protein [unclassified Chelatococcus]MBS7696793.1 ABC transporter substrate-binding protein [Chelatococcus sp. YT9]MBX3558369.1 ABC transporter substrate-binding protein [Chelatococcus sp.]
MFNKPALKGAIALAAFACVAWPHMASAQNSAQVPAKGSANEAATELVLAQGADPLGFNPTRFSAPNTSYLHQLYDTLVEIGPDGQPRPSLAESWERSADGLSVTFKLRPAKFHSGRPLTAQDVVYSVRYHLDPANAANLLARLSAVKDVEALDDRTVKLTLSSLAPGLYDLLSALFILDEKAVVNMAQQDAGSGPFIMKSWTPGVSYTMERFADHWSNDRTKPDRITVRIVPDDAAGAALLQTRAVDVLYTAGPLALAQLKDAAGTKIERIKRAPRSHYLALNTSRAPLDNKLVRQAISHAINRDMIASVVYNDFAAPSCQPWAESHWAYAPAVDKLCGYDLEKAKALMKESGVGPFTMTVNTSTDSYAPGSVDTAQILKEDLAALGITLNIATYEPAKARELILGANFDMLLHNYIEGGNDPQFIIPSAIYGPTKGRTKFTSPAFEALVEKAGKTLDLNERKAIYADISKLIADEAFMLPFAHEFRPIPMIDAVKNFEMDGSGFSQLQQVDVTR